jgi:hypothetical protein
MGYFYGDSTESPFTSNVLEFLRDAIDFSVETLEADQRIRSGRAHVESLRERARIELDEVAALRKAVADAIESMTLCAADSPAARCAAGMNPACDQVVHAVVQSVHAQLASDITQAENEEAREREARLQALMTLLGTNGPPDSSAVLHVRLRETGGYHAWIDGACPAIGLTWSCETALPPGQSFEEPLRVERLQQGLDVHAPELTGWLRKEVKVRPQHLQRYLITEVDRAGRKIVLRLRMEPTASVGFDLECDLDAGTIVAARVGEDSSAGRFDVEETDAPKLIALAETVHKKLENVTCVRLTEAKLGDVDFRALPTFVDMVERLIAQLAPMVQAIARHSLEPNELILRWRLSNDRREEIFVSKSTLREKYERLPEGLSALFEPLGLGTSRGRAMRSHGPPGHDPGTSRSELSPSRRPPPKPTGRAPAPPPPVPEATPELEPEPKVILRPDVQRENDAPAGVLGKIVEFANAGSIVDACQECAALLESPLFVDCSLEDQRQALTLLRVLSKTAAPSEALQAAHRVARDRAAGLVERTRDPADYELLGLCHVSLDEHSDALESFRKGLELEQSRNTESELCARLARHIGGL